MAPLRLQRARAVWSIASQALTHLAAKITLFVNWLVKPFSMALLGWLFVRVLFGDVLGWIDAETGRNYSAGLIILAAAPCTAMVFVWSYLTDV